MTHSLFIASSSLKGGQAQLSLPLSRKYNLKHYYWALKCREDIAVVLCAAKGKARIMSTKEAERLYGK